MKVNKEQKDVERKSSGDSESVGKFFDDYADVWDEFYKKNDGRSFDYLNRQRVLLDLFTQYVPTNMKVLEIGCGSGHTAVELSKRGYVMTCLDVSEKMIEHSRENFIKARQKADFIHGDVSDVKTENSFQSVFGTGVMDYVEDEFSTLEKINKLLIPGGFCFLSFSNASTPLRWIEMPIKRTVALGTYLISRNQLYGDVAFRPSSAHRIKFVRELYRKAGFEVVELAFFSYGIRMGKNWLPPLSIVRGLDKKLSKGTFSTWGRGFIAVGRKP